MSKRAKTRYTAEEKSKILKRHLVEGEEISALCDEFNISPATFYNWQKKLFENAPSVLEAKRPGRSPSKQKDDEIKRLQEKLAHKDTVLAEAMEAMMLAKKLNGENSKISG